MPTTFTLTAADFARLQKVVGRRVRQRLGLFSLQFFLRVLVWLCVGFAVATYARLLREYPEISGPLEVVAALLVVALLAVVAMPHVAQVALRKHMLAPNGAFLSPQTVQLSASGVSVSSATGNAVVPWSGVIARDEDDANYYLFIDTMQALVLPRSAIAAFVGEFEQYTRHLKSAV